MPFDLIIRNGNVVRDERVERADIAIQFEKIVEVAPRISGATREQLDAKGLHIFPGVIDPHVHFNEPGRTDWEGFATGSAAFAAGGGTLFFDMPLNSSPPVLDGASFDLKLEAAMQSSHTDFALWGGLTPRNLDRMEELAERGVVGFKAFMCDSGIADFPRIDEANLLEGMRRAAMLRLPVAVHAELQEITARLTESARAERRTGIRDWLNTRPEDAESGAIALAIRLAIEAGCALHIVHVSHPAGVATAHESAKGHSVDVSCETCPHYLLFDEDDLLQAGPLLKCAPPLRHPTAKEVLRKWLALGRIDFVASDHSPAPASMKRTSNFFDVWGGIPGVQSTLPVLLSFEDVLGPHQVARLTASAAAKRYNIAGKGSIGVGADADLTFVDLSRTFELRREDLLDRHKLSPYVGRTFRGVIHRTILRGRTIYLDGKITGHPIGKIVRPQR